jgi:hypothetical protein
MELSDIFVISMNFLNDREPKFEIEAIKVSQLKSLDKAPL